MVSFFLFICIFFFPRPQCVLITGATSGIGEELAKAYAKDGVTIAISGRNEQALKATAAACNAKGATVISHKGDVTDKDAMKTWIQKVDAATPIDLVIANAGVTETTANVAADVEASARTVFDINVTGVWNTIFPALDGMRERQKGQVAIISSLAGFGPLSGSAAYAASKAAVKTYGESLRWQMKREGVRVNIVTPGYVSTPLTAANKFVQPGMVTTDYAVKRIISGLAADEPIIAFPTSTYVAAWFMGSIPPVIKDFISRNRLINSIAYWKAKKGEKPAAAVSGNSRKNK